MAQQNIDFGAFPNDQNADAIRVAFQKVQNNFTELYSVIYLTGVTKVIAGQGISVDQNTGNVTVTNRLNSVTLQTGNSLRVGVSTATSNIATINSSTTPLAINLANTISTVNVVATGNLVGRLAANSANQPNITNVGTLSSLSVTGNVRGGTFIGNVSATYINATAIDAPGSNTQILLNRSGNIGALSNLTYNSTTNILGLTGAFSTNGNVTGANLLTGGTISATGSINSAGITSNGNISATGNIIANTNLRANGTITVTGNGVFGNVRTAGAVSAAGNVFGDWFIGNLANGTTRIEIPTANADVQIQVANVSNVVTISTANANFLGNIISTSDVSAVSIIASNMIDAAGDIEAGGDLTIYGNANIVTNASIGNVFTTRVVASGNISGSQNLNLSGNISTGGSLSATNANLVGNISVGNVGPSVYTPAATIGANGNIRSLNLVTGNISASTLSTSGNITATNFIGNGALLTNLPGALVTGNVPQSSRSFQAANITTATGDVDYKLLLNTQTNNGDNSAFFSGATFNPAFGILTANNLSAVGGVQTNICYANTVSSFNLTTGIAGQQGNITGNWQLTTGSRLTATYADLAENYAGDQFLDPGYVIEFGGENEVTLCLTPNSTKVAGVVSTNPAYVMNGMIKCIYPVSIALQGRVPTKVTGKISKGDLMVSAGNGLATACSSPIIGSVIGKSLEDFEGSLGTIEIAIGRL